MYCSTPLETCAPSKVIDVVSMLKAVIVEAALTKVLAIALSLGADADAKTRSALLMIDPLLNETTVRERNPVKFAR